MIRIALRMLTGDTAKYVGLIGGVAFAVMLMAQQGSIFVGLMLGRLIRFKDKASTSPPIA